MNFTQLSSCLPVAKSQAQTACPIGCSLNSGRCQSCWQSCKRPFKLNMALLATLHDSRGHHLNVQEQGLQGLVGQLPSHYPPQQRLQASSQEACSRLWLLALGLPSSRWTPLRPLLCLVGGLATMYCVIWRRRSTADSLALVPLTPDDSHAPNLRRSSREHKKPKPF